MPGTKRFFISVSPYHYITDFNVTPSIYEPIPLVSPNASFDFRNQIATTIMPTISLRDGLKGQEFNSDPNFRYNPSASMSSYRWVYTGKIRRVYWSGMQRITQIVNSPYTLNSTDLRYATPSSFSPDFESEGENTHSLIEPNIHEVDVWDNVPISGNPFYETFGPYKRAKFYITTTKDRRQYIRASSQEVKFKIYYQVNQTSSGDYIFEEMTNTWNYFMNGYYYTTIPSHLEWSTPLGPQILIIAYVLRESPFEYTLVNSNIFFEYFVPSNDPEDPEVPIESPYNCYIKSSNDLIKVNAFLKTETGVVNVFMIPKLN